MSASNLADDSRLSTAVIQLSSHFAEENNQPKRGRSLPACKLGQFVHAWKEGRSEDDVFNKFMFHNESGLSKRHRVSTQKHTEVSVHTPRAVRNDSHFTEVVKVTME